jgi:Rrf2 family cysteine metabolism transcriptional repressor
MKTTAKTKYALIFMLDLAVSYDSEKMASVHDVAEKEKIPSKFLEQIVAVLKSKDLIQAQRGAKGGYRLSRSPDQIHLRSIIEAVQGPVCHEAFDLPLPDSPSQNVVSGLLSRLSEKSAEFLDSQNLADLLQSRQSIKTDMFHI